MDYSLMMACLVINTLNHEARSALPNAPIVTERPARHAHRRMARLQGWLASVLHRAAWAIEPDPLAVTPSTPVRNVR